MYLLDTDTIGNLLKKSPSIQLIQRLARTPVEEQFTSAITVGELAYGSFRRPDGGGLWKRIRDYLHPLQVLPFDYESSLTYGRVRAELEKKGIVLPEADLRIGAIALSRRMTVVTGNQRHFVRIPNLNVENWL